MIPSTLKILSFNCWGLLYISKHRRFRFKAIAEALSNEDYDIIALQEIWVKSDFEFMREKLQSVLPYAKYFYSGAFGSGLAIFSRFPILSSTFHKYTLNGKPLKIFHGDYYVGKGVGVALLDHPQLGPIHVFNTHLHAGYGDGYKAYRASECWELANLVRSSAAKHILLTGDLNSIPDSLNYRLIRDHGLLKDTWSKSQDLGFTCNSPFNTFSPYYQRGDATVGKKLDYIFYKPSPHWSCAHSKVVLTHFIPGHDMSYSDHFGISSCFRIQQSNNTNEPAGQLGLQTIEAFQTLLDQELVSAKRDARRLIVCMFVCIFCLVALFPITILFPTLFRLRSHGELATILVPLFGNIMVIVFSAVASISLIVGLVFGETEKRALLEFIDQVKIYRHSIEKNT